MYKILSAISLFVLIQLCSHGQWVMIDEFGGTPDSSAALEVSDTSRGVLLPRLTSAQMNSITSPAEGLLLYNSDSSEFYYHNGSQWQSTSTFVPTSISNSGIAILYDSKSTSTDGGTFTSGAWQDRTLNTIDGDTSFVSLSGTDSFVLQPGLYSIEWITPAYRVGQTQSRLYNSTSSSVEKYSSSEFSSTSSVTQVQCLGQHLIQINIATTFKIQHRAATTRATDGYGLSAGFGTFEIYSQVSILKIN